MGGPLTGTGFYSLRVCRLGAPILDVETHSLDWQSTVYTVCGFPATDFGPDEPLTGPEVYTLGVYSVGVASH